MEVDRLELTSFYELVIAEPARTIGVGEDRLPQQWVETIPATQEHNRGIADRISFSDYSNHPRQHRFGRMRSDVTQLCNAMASGDPLAASKLLPLVYDELRLLAAQKMAREKPGQTLQATALVHEAWLRLGGDADRPWPARTYFFAAAAEAMRRILIEKARRSVAARKAGLVDREELSESSIVVRVSPDELLAVHEALGDLESEDAKAAELVKLRYFAGMAMPEAAQAMQMPLRSAERLWSFAKVFLKSRMRVQRGERDTA